MHSEGRARPRQVLDTVKEESSGRLFGDALYPLTLFPVPVTMLRQHLLELLNEETN